MFEITVCTDPAMAIPVTALLNQELGDDCHKAEEIGDLMSSDVGTVLVAHSEGQLVGVATGLILRREDPEGWMLDELDPEDSEHVGLLQSVAVVPESRGLGIGTALAVQRMEALEDLGATVVIAFSWESGQAGRSRPVLERLGFKVFRGFENAWDGQPCPVCGNSCACGASLMVYRFDGARCHG